MRAAQDGPWRTCLQCIPAPFRFGLLRSVEKARDGPSPGLLGRQRCAQPRGGSNASAFVSALRAEYIAGKDGAVGEFFDVFGATPEYSALEERVRTAGDKVAALAEIQHEVCKPPQDEHSPPPGSTAPAFVSALCAEYIEGKAGAVGDLFDEFGATPQYIALEKRVCDAGDRAAAIAEIRGELCEEPQGDDCPSPGKSKPGASAQGPFDFKAWCANHSFMSRMVRDAADVQVQKDMAANGSNAELDAECMRYGYSLLGGKYESNNAKVEIEDTKTREAREDAIARLQAFKMPILAVGFSLQAMIVLAMLCTLATADCETGTSKNQLLVTIVVALCMFAVLFGTVDHLLNLQSNTTFEGVPLVRFSIQTAFLDMPPSNPHILTVLVLNAAYGKIAGAAFIGRIIMCSAERDASLHDHTLNSLFHAWSTGHRTHDAAFGLSAVATVFFIVPLLIQFARMYRSVRSIRRAFDGFQSQPEEGHGAHLCIGECIDDFSSIADWALLLPVAKVFEKAAFPLALADENDAARIWDLLKTRACAQAANLFPDAIVKLWLCCINFVLVANAKGPMDKAQLALLAASSAATALVAGLGLIKRSFCLTVLIGLLIVVSVILPIVFAAATLSCGEGSFGTIGFTCLAMEE